MTSAHDPQETGLAGQQLDLESIGLEVDPLDGILTAVLALSERERDLLWRRLRAVGLLPAAGDVTDRGRLAVAPAVTGAQGRIKEAGAGYSAGSSTGSSTGTNSASAGGSRFVPPQPPAQSSDEASKPSKPSKSSQSTESNGAAEAATSGQPAKAPEASKSLSLFSDSAPASDTAPSLTTASAKSQADAPYKSSVSGKVVVKSTAPQGQPSPHQMAPLPGQAPEQPIGVIFDGGSKGNPGLGYGSYALRWPGQAEQIVKLRFGDRVTNNEAEYDTLIAALEAILARLADMGADPGTARIQVRGDSLLVINQITGAWKCKQDRLRLRRDKARALLKQLGAWQLTHHDRSNSVRVLGH